MLHGECHTFSKLERNVILVFDEVNLRAEAGFTINGDSYDLHGFRDPIFVDGTYAHKPHLDDDLPSYIGSDALVFQVKGICHSVRNHPCMCYVHGS